MHYCVTALGILTRNVSGSFILFFAGVMLPHYSEFTIAVTTNCAVRVLRGNDHHAQSWTIHSRCFVNTFSKENAELNVCWCNHELNGEQRYKF